jgi:hypothetical protein
MTAASVVGKSNRTPGKHEALDKYLGKTAGVISKRYRDKRIFFIDCTAGDGNADDFDRQTSPGIMIRHAEWLRNQGIPVQVMLFERSLQNAAMLEERVAGRADIFAKSSAQMDPIQWRQNEDLVFISNDPNTIADWALPPALLSAPSLTTVFSTLGCNVGGLKRLPRDQRRVWHDHIRDQVGLLQGWHDAMLCRLINDASQWAYLVNSPTKWRKELEQAFRSSFDRVGYETRTDWLKTGRAGFDDSIDQLFLTKDEYNARKPV